MSPQEGTSRTANAVFARLLERDAARIFETQKWANPLRYLASPNSMVLATPTRSFGSSTGCARLAAGIFASPSAGASDVAHARPKLAVVAEHKLLRSRAREGLENLRFPNPGGWTPRRPEAWLAMPAVGVALAQIGTWKIGTWQIGTWVSVATVHSGGDLYIVVLGAQEPR